MNQLSRREFLGATGLIAATATLPFPRRLFAAEPGAAVDIYDRPLRWVQLTLTEPDPATADLNFWLDYFKRLHADAAVLSAGGCMAFYPTKIPFHHKSTAMKDGDDPFGKLAAGCRKMGMVVVARIDPHSILDDAAQAHPEWVAVEADGSKRRHWADPKRWVTCGNGPYNFDFMTGVVREIATNYKDTVDGIFGNRWQGSGMCYCAFCREQFKKDTGQDLRPGALWNEWHKNRMIELVRLWSAEVRKAIPHGTFVANAGASDLGLGDKNDGARVYVADRQSRDARPVPPWLNARNGKEYRAIAGNKPVIGIFSIGRDDTYRWKDAVQSSAELRVWVAEGIAGGMEPWLSKFCGTLYDERWLPVAEDIYQWLWKNERYLRNTESLARVALVECPQSGRRYNRNDLEAHEFGFHEALVEGRVPFEMVHELKLDAASTERYKLLILPSAACLSDAQCAQLRNFVKRGGSLLATYETSLYDENGRPRNDFALGDLFGVRYTRLETAIKNSYIRIEAQTKHPILRGLENAGRIINTINRVTVEAIVPMPNPPLTQVPSYPDLPMEEVYPRQPKTNIPDVFLREFGQGRVVYFPGDINRSFWEIFEGDQGKLLANAAQWALNEEPAASVTGPGVIDVSVWRQKDSMTVHLVNLTNPMMMKGPFRELIAVGSQEVTVRLPAGKKPKAVKLLAENKTARFRQTGATLHVTVPFILVHEVIAIDL